MLLKGTLIKAGEKFENTAANLYIRQAMKNCKPIWILVIYIPPRIAPAAYPAIFRAMPASTPTRICSIQTSLEAGYYIRSGRARQITREEAEAIIETAECHGLVHQIFNNEGMNQSTFICSCRGCFYACPARGTGARGYD